MKHVLAVDGGSSKTLGVVADERGEVLSLSKGGGSNYMHIGRKAVAKMLNGLIESVMNEASLMRVDAACYGMAGADRDKDFQVIREILEPIDPSEKSVLVNDTLLALRAGTPDGVGVALVGGTGSNCIGRDKAGRIRKVGGLGPITGDKANAEALVMEAIIASMKGGDGRAPKTLLEDKLKEALGLSVLEDVIEFEIYDSRRNVSFGDFAPLVFQSADEGDEVALTILREHGEAASEAALAVMCDLFSPDQDVPLILGGSVLQKGSNPALVNTIKKNVALEFPKVRIVLLSDPPIMGGILMALDKIGVSLSDDSKKKIRRQLNTHMVSVTEDNRNK